MLSEEDFLKRGLEKLNLRDYNGALQDINIAIHLNPRFEIAYFHRAILKKDYFKDLKGAIEDCNEAIKLFLFFSDAALLRGLCKSELEDYKNAINDYSIAILGNLNYFTLEQAYLNRGVAKGEILDYQGAIEDIQEALKLKPDYVNAFINLGYIKSLFGKKNDALKLFNRALEFDPDNIQAKRQFDICHNYIMNNKYYNDCKQDLCKIDSQTWMSENLNVDRFRNGDIIPQAKTNDEWHNAGKEMKPAWCYYDNDSENGEIYGKLYNWYAVNDPRGLAPLGFHIPSLSEWEQLANNLGGRDNCCIKIKSKSGWNEYLGKTGNGINTSGFTALPAGARSYNSFESVGAYSYWWCSTEYDKSEASIFFLSNNDTHIYRKLEYDKLYGMSVRCIQDTVVVNKDYVKDIDSNSYNVVKIGEQIWMTENLNVTRFRDGTLIQEAKTSEEWIKAGDESKPAWCFYENNPENGKKYGKLYNWFAVNSPNGLAPYNFHIAQIEEWSSLINYFGGAYTRYNVENTSVWKEINDESILNAFSKYNGVQRNSLGKFTAFKRNNIWWSSTEYNENSAFFFIGGFHDGNFLKDAMKKHTGFSVRCLKVYKKVLTR